MLLVGDFAVGVTRPSGIRRVRSRLTAAAAAALLLAAAGPGAAQAPAASTAAPIAPVPLANAGAGAPTLREGVAAVVNDEIISTYDLRQRVLLLIVTSGVQVTNENLAQIQREALRDLIDERLELQEVRRIQARTKTVLEPTPQELTEQVTASISPPPPPAKLALGTPPAAKVAASFEPILGYNVKAAVRSLFEPKTAFLDTGFSSETWDDLSTANFTGPAVKPLPKHDSIQVPGHMVAEAG